MDGSIPTGASVLETAESELESTDSSADSSADSAKVSVWVQASISPPYLAICVKIKDEIPTRCCNLFGFDVSIEHFIRNNQYEINMPDKKPTLVYIQSKPYSTSLSWGSHWDSIGADVKSAKACVGSAKWRWVRKGFWIQTCRYQQREMLALGVYTNSNSFAFLWNIIGLTFLLIFWLCSPVFQIAHFFPTLITKAMYATTG